MCILQSGAGKVWLLPEKAHISEDLIRKIKKDISKIEGYDHLLL